MVLEKTPESLLDYKEIKAVNPKGNQFWIFIGRTDAEAEAPILWPPDAKSQLIGKDPDAGKDWGQEEKGATEDEMIGWHHWLNRCEFEQIQGHSGGEGEMYGKSNMETYITVCKIDSQREFAVWLRKLKQGLCINLEGWDGEGDGRFQNGGDICIPMADSCWGLTENNKIL